MNTAMVSMSLVHAGLNYSTEYLKHDPPWRSLGSPCVQYSMCCTMYYCTEYPHPHLSRTHPPHAIHTIVSAIPDTLGSCRGTIHIADTVYLPTYIHTSSRVPCQSMYYMYVVCNKKQYQAFLLCRIFSCPTWCNKL